MSPSHKNQLDLFNSETSADDAETSRTAAEVTQAPRKNVEASVEVKCVALDAGMEHPTAAYAADDLRSDNRPRKMFLSDKEVAERYSVSRPTIWRWTKTAPGFPSPVQLAPGTTRWAVDDLENYERGRASARGGSREERSS